MMRNNQIVRRVVLGVGFILLLALLLPTVSPQEVVYAQGPGSGGQAPSPPPRPPSPGPLKAKAPRGPLWTNFQAAEFVLGQANFNTNAPGFTASTFRLPQKVAIDPTTNKVFVSDFDNNRVLRFASWATLANGAAAEAVLGQVNFTSFLYSCTQSGMGRPIGVSVDSSGRLWVGEYASNRVLRFDNASTKTNGANADGVLGQSDFTNCNLATQQNRMNYPGDVHIDAAGRLWVADRYNNRVLRFDNAAAKANGANADGVLGQTNFTTSAQATTQSGMNEPTALVLDGSGNLFVGDSGGRRVLRFNNAAAKANGANADGVLGQPNFTSSASTTTQTGMGRNFGVTVDQYGRLYVSDWENHRILIYNYAATLANGAAASNVLGQPDFTSSTINNGGLSASSMFCPMRLFFDNVGRRLWIADEQNNRVLRYLEVAAATTVGLTSSLNPSTIGKAVTFTAVIIESNPATATGLVTFYAGGVPIAGCTNVVLSIAAQATCTIASPPAGSSAITAMYGGDATFMANTSAVLVQVVNQQPAQPAQPSEVPEADTLLLMGSGIGGLATWLRWQWSKRRARRGV